MIYLENYDINFANKYFIFNIIRKITRLIILHEISIV